MREAPKRKIVLAVGIVLIFTWLFIIISKGTSTPSFCNSCHYMEPYYANWLSSSHVMVECNDCHYGKGFSGWLRSKGSLLGESLKYLTGTYSLNPRARVQDTVCLDCHEDEIMNDELMFLNRVKFSHDNHYAEPSRGIRLHCAACHSDLVQGSHLAVTSSSCFYCHFPGAEPHGEKGECKVCHGAPRNDVQTRGIKFSHSKYLDSGVDCYVCHLRVTSGTGGVPREHCSNCHLQKFDEMGGTVKVHSVHVTDQQIPCADCHLKISHGNITIAEPLMLDCENCHARLHSDQESMYLGIGVGEVGPMPDVMFLAGVSCTGCHESAITALDPSVTGAGKVRENACSICHEKEYDALSYSWTRTIDNFTSNLIDRLEVLRKVDVTSRAAEYVNVVLQDGSQGAHNIRYAYKLLKRSEEIIMENEHLLWGAGASRGKITSSSNLDCVSRCHVGIEWLDGVSESGFGHKDHIMYPEMDCSACHSVTEHGVSYASTEQCSKCHHDGELENCSNCHSLQQTVYEGTFSSSRLPDIMYDGGVECQDCHLTDGDIPVRPSGEVCVECHDAEYEDMMVEWQGEINRSLAALTELVKSAEEEWDSQERGNLRDTYGKILSSRNLLHSIEEDGSAGVHNYALQSALLEEEKEEIRQIIAELKEGNH